MKRLQDYIIPEIPDEQKFDINELRPGRYTFYRRIHNSLVELVKLVINDDKHCVCSCYDVDLRVDKKILVKVPEELILTDGDIDIDFTKYTQVYFELYDDLMSLYKEIYNKYKDIFTNLVDKYAEFKNLKNTDAYQEEFPLSERVPGTYHLVYAPKEISDYISIVKVVYKSEDNCDVYFKNYAVSPRINEINLIQSSLFKYGKNTEFGDQLDNYTYMMPISQNYYNSYLVEIEELYQQKSYVDTSLYIITK